MYGTLEIIFLHFAAKKLQLFKKMSIFNEDFGY